MTKVYCEECQWAGTSEQCLHPERARVLIQPGEVLSHGNCPECGTSCYDAQGLARKHGPDLLDALKDAEREMEALIQYGQRRFGDEWWPAKDRKYVEALVDLVMKERYDDVIAHAEIPNLEGELHDRAENGKPA
jgi:hypothetical protein